MLHPRLAKKWGGQKKIFAPPFTKLCPPHFSNCGAALAEEREREKEREREREKDWPFERQTKL